MQKGSLMTKENIKSKKGFTIIEVVLVLAIAGLIFLMVFVALPALQRSQRDTQRRDDMARFMSQLSQYQANNNGQVPSGNNPTAIQASYNRFITNYLKAGGDTFADPSTGADYKIVAAVKCTTGSAGCPNQTTSTTAEYSALGAISVYTNATCNGENPVYIKGDRKVAITLKLEGAGIYCGHN